MSQEHRRRGTVPSVLRIHQMHEVVRQDFGKLAEFRATHRTPPCTNHLLDFANASTLEAYSNVPVDRQMRIDSDSLVHSNNRQ